MNNMLSANQFVEELQSLLSIGDRQVRVRVDGGLIFINFINLPQGISGGGGAERENNRAMWMLSGFHKDPTIPVEKIRLKESVSVFDQHLKGKTGKPEAIAQYLASFINKLVAEVPPKYTHSKPPVTSYLKKAVQELVGSEVEVLSSYDPGDSHSMGELSYKVKTPLGVFEFIGYIAQNGEMEVERLTLDGLEVPADMGYPDVKIVHSDAGSKAVEAVRRSLNTKIQKAVVRWVREYGEEEADWEPLSNVVKDCAHFDLWDKVCVTGCKAKRVAVGGKCPWEGSWDEAKRECSCYKPLSGKVRRPG